MDSRRNKRIVRTRTIFETLPPALFFYAFLIKKFLITNLNGGILWKSANTDRKTMKTKSTTNIVRLKAKKLPLLTDSEIDGSRQVGEFIVTPKMARKILEKRNSTPAGKAPAYTNRNLRGKGNKKTDRLVMDIKEGYFYPSLLKFSTEGVLLDGQHRLFAIGQTTKNLPMIVETGADPASMLKIDRGILRTDKDILGLTILQNEEWNLIPTHWTKAVQIGRRWIAWNGIDSRKKGSIEAQLVNGTGSNPSDKTLIDFFQTNREHIKFATQVVPRNKHTRLFCRVSGLLTFAMMHKINPEKAQEFAVRMVSGGSIKGKNCPSQVARKVMMNTENTQCRSAFVGEFSKLLYCAKQYLAGKKVQRVRSINKLRGA